MVKSTPYTVTGGTVCFAYCAF